MKKAFDQTVRDLKREVNKKVLKVPSVEQKVLDATSNEPWGPHGSLLADIAQATKNYHEYQMIMSVIWKRINDTGKNWRHVYKALVVLDYLVANGSERVIDEIREHAYQISTLSDFQYIDSSGRDQGNNVRKKSQNLVVLVNDKERLQEARQKAAANRDKFRSNHAGSMNRPGYGYGDRYDDDQYEGRYRDDERNGNMKDRDWGSRDDDRYGRQSYTDDDSRGRGQRVDGYHGSRGRSAESYRNAVEDDGQYSSRGSGAKADDHSQDGSVDKKLDRKYSGQGINAPPSYEDAVGSARSPSYSERDGEPSQASAPKASLPSGASPTHAAVSATTSPPANVSSPTPILASSLAPPQSEVQTSDKEVDGFDEFDPRRTISAALAPSEVAKTPPSDVEMDLLGSLESAFAIVPVSQPATPEADASANSTSGTTVASSQPSSAITSHQSFDDPFGDGPFKAVTAVDSVPAQQHIYIPSNQGQDASPIPRTPPSDNGGASHVATYMPSDPSSALPPASTQFGQQEFTSPSQDIDILADILPPAPAPAVTADAQAGFLAASNQSVPHSGYGPEANQLLLQSGLASEMAHGAPQNGFQSHSGQPGSFPAQHGQPSIQASHALMSAQPMPQTGFANQVMGFTYPVQAGHHSQMGFHPQGGIAQAGPLQPSLSNPNAYGAGAYHSQPIATGQSAAYGASPSSSGIGLQNHFYNQTGSAPPIASQIGPQVPQLLSATPVLTQPSEDKFKTKSSVWNDALSRGLVNLNISGPKANPLADIGVDFDSINRREKRMEKPTTTSVTSTVTMGKAMGAGSGIGRAGAGSLRPPANPMVGPAPNMGMPGGMSFGGYGVGHPAGRDMGINLNMPGSMGVGMNMGMGQAMNIQRPIGFPPGYAAPGGGYNMGGAGNYSQPPPYGGGYR